MKSIIFVCILLVTVFGVTDGVSERVFLIFARSILMYGRLKLMKKHFFLVICFDSVCAIQMPIHVLHQNVITVAAHHGSVEQISVHRKKFYSVFPLLFYILSKWTLLNIVHVKILWFFFFAASYVWIIFEETPVYLNCLQQWGTYFQSISETLASQILSVLA